MSGQGMKAENPSTAFARVFVDELVRCGLTDAVLAPGSRSAPLAMALHADARVRLHVRVDERSAAFLALGLARASGRPAAVLCTSGTAAANLHPAVLEAHESRTPLLVLTADRPPELRGTGANQTTDQIKLYGGAVRWFCEVGVPEDRPGMVSAWRATTCRAWAEASGSPPGPVHLNVALREPLTPEPSGEGFVEPLDGRPGGQPWLRVTRRYGGGAAPDDDLVERLTARVAEAHRGVLVAGDGAADADALVAFAEAAGWPVLAEPTSGARRGPNAVSAPLLAAPAFAAAHRPDLVVRVGRPALSRPLAAWLDADVPQVLVDADGAWLDPGRSLSELVVAAPGPLLDAVGQRLAAAGHAPRADWLARWRDAERRARTALDALLDAEGLSEPRVARDLAAGLPSDAALVVGSSMPIRDLDQAMAPRGGLRVFANRGVSGIDGFVSTAVGVALAAGVPTAALCGDLSLLHDANGLLGAEADLLLVVVNNDGGGIFSFLPQARHPEGFERLFGTPHGADLAALARAYGAAYRLLTTPADLADAVTGVGRERGVRLAEVRSERAANADLHQRLREAVAAAVG